MENEEKISIKKSLDVAPEVINSKIKNIKYPFNGVAPNLIDKFLVVGYEQKELDIVYAFNEVEPNISINTKFKFFECQERPGIINEICYDYLKDMLDNDLILELIFPNLPQIYFLEKQYINTKKNIQEEMLLSPYSIIFSINPQDNSNSKKSYNGLAYIFYYSKEFKTAMNNLEGISYSPIAYVILSEFPYFYHFKEMCINIFMQMKKENDEIPIDIILYNVVKYCPSPINKTINLSFGAELAKSSKEKLTINEILEPLNKVFDINEEKKGIPSFFFNQLCGYPILDFNLSFIFNILPPEIICEVFIFSFLEHDIIFYSQNPEILNITMYIFSNLNYPFNDSIYYWHILSVSKESFMSGSSTFVGKTCSTLTGILGEYDSELLTTKKIREHFVLDIDNKNFFFLFQEETDEVKETMDLYTYIKNCSSEVEDYINDSQNVDKETKKKNYFKDGINLFDAIQNLMEELQRRTKKVTSVDYNMAEIKPTFLSMYQDESEAECMKANLRLQKAFFSFITQIIQKFLSILVVGDDKKSQGNESFQIFQKKEDNKDNINEEEIKKRQLAKRAGDIFKNKFRDSSKYSSFVINFCMYHDTIDLYKIPYTFTNELMYYSYVAEKNNLSEVDVFKLIDQFYGRKEMINLEEFIIKTEEDIFRIKHYNEKDLRNIFHFSFDKFSEFFNKKLRADINREQEDDRDIFIKLKSNKTNNYKKYKRNGFFLSKKLLLYYTVFSNNNYSKLKDLFKLTKCEYKKEDDELFIGRSSTNDEFWSGFEVVEKTNEHEIILNSASALINYKKKKKEKKSSIIENNENIINDSEDDNKNQIMEDINQINIDNQEKEVYIDYDSIKEKDKFKKDLIFYGGYEFMEITDVIEKYFIIERSFTSYGLIKFSLLNILAITRGIKGQKMENNKVIQLMCDFCEITKTLARKYMNIFLNIFQALIIKKIINEEKDNNCLNIIKSYFTRTNMIPTEETNNIIEKINSHRGSILPKPQNLEQKNVNQNEELEKLEIKNQFFDVKDYKKIKKYDNALKVIETIFSGKFGSNSKTINFGYKCLEDLYMELEEDNKDEKKFVPETPLSLYISTHNLLNHYLNNNFSNNKNIYRELEIDILSLMYYFKIPIIGRKWVEKYKSEREITILKDKNKDKKHDKSKNKDKKQDKDKNKDKNKDKKKDKNKDKIKDKNKDNESIKEKEKEEENKKKEISEVNNVNNIINSIIFVLEDLFNIIKESKNVN